jgi:TonB-linked SusC/RagA family outer membrane protein
MNTRTECTLIVFCYCLQIKSKTKINDMKRLIILFISVQWISFAFAQPRQLQGKVSSIDGNGLIGVNVSVEDTGSNTTTDPDGNYRISVNTGDKLSFTYLGYKKETVTVSDQEVVNVTLKEGRNDLLLKITGTIIDAHTGNPLAGAQIRTKGTQIAAMTGETGDFEINLPSLYEILLISMPGYTLREAPLQGRSQLRVALYPEFFSSGYEQKEVDFSLSTALSPDNEIQTRLGSEVRTITRSGINGMGAAMFIRGFNSLNSNAQPLFVVDGVIWNNPTENFSVHEGFFANPLASIDVKDIESITVLKDGASIYGSKAANGVILINTVQSKEMATQIAASAVFGSSQKPFLPEMMDVSQYRIYASNQIKGLTAYGYREQEISEMRFLNEDPTTSYYKDYHNNSNWRDEVYQNGTSQSYSISVNGGDDVALYSLSMGYALDESALKNTDMERLNARFNSDINLSSRLSTKVNIAITKIDRNLHSDGVNEIASPGFISLIKAPFLASHVYTLSDGEISPKLSNYDQIDPLRPVSNPVSLVENAMEKTTQINFNLNLRPEYRISKNLKVSSLFGYGFNRIKESYFIPAAGTAPQSINLYGKVDNELKDLTQRKLSIFSDTRADWNFDLGYNHHFLLLGGFRYMSDTYEIDLPKGYNGGNDHIKVLLSGLSYKSVDGVDSQWKSLSGYINAGYDFQKKYFLTLTASSDASSRFGQKVKSGFSAMGVNWALFPSVEAAWVVSAEKFMQNLPLVNFLKLRAGYGLTGNDDIDIYAGRSFFTSQRYMERAVGLQLANIKNEAIQWETSAKATAGIDLHFLNERLGISFDVFNNRTKNLLTQKQLKSITGLEYYWDNGGEMKNKGYEIALNAKVLNLRNLKWELGGSVAHYKNEITALDDGDYTTSLLNASILTAVGHPAGVFYGYKTEGVFATTQKAQEANLYLERENGSQSYFTAGDMHFVDSYKDGIINEKDRQIIGDPNPDFYGTFSNRFQVKNFTLDVIFTYSLGNDVYNYLRSQLESGSNLYNQTVAMQNRWTTEGQITDMPKAVYGDPMNNNAFSDRWIEDGSYCRLKTLTLSYEWQLNQSFLQKVTFWASANNLWTWSKYLGGDPEFSMNNAALYQGIDAGLTPQSRSYYIGVKINL